MNRFSIGLLAILLPSLATCCPTLWLQVNKDNPAPWPSVQVLGVDETPYLIPPTAPNRFDVLEKDGARTVAASGFTDALDPKSDVNGQRTRALDALSWIQQRYGKPALLNCKVKATLLCDEDDKCGTEGSCYGLHLDGPVDQVQAVVVKQQHLAVMSKDSQGNLELSSSVPGIDGESIEVCVEPTLELPSTLLSFVHLSDIQLRDPSITLSDRRLSHKLDWFDALSSFEYDEDLASYNQYVVEAVFATINGIAGKAPIADAPKFIVHTGDSIDSGAMSELDRIHVLIDRLRIPFFELFGNHDLLMFGNLAPTVTHDDDATCSSVSSLLGSQRWYVPNKICVDQWVSCSSCIGSEGDMVARTTQELTRQRFMSRLEHLRADRLAEQKSTQLGSYCPDTKPQVRNASYTRAHGFDLGTEDDRLDGRKLGYYAFVEPLKGSKRQAVFIALNSEELTPGQGGTRGRMGKAQFDWLRSVLSCVSQKEHRGDLVFVFAHQPLSQIDVDGDAKEPTPDLATLLEEHSNNVKAFFYGHSHTHSICGDSRKGVCSKFWEVETASLIEFPQEGRIVRIKSITDDLAFLELTALRERLTNRDTQLARYVDLARRGAERDFCYTHRETTQRCSADSRPYRTDGRDANARLFFRLP